MAEQPVIKDISFHLNGTPVSIKTASDTPVLYVLRNDFGLNGPKFGCGLGQCAACMILLDGRAVPSCQVTADAVQSKEITTLTGLLNDGSLSQLQQAFVDEQAAQCGYCLNGMIITAHALKEESGSLDEEAIQARLGVNLCRCGTHVRILRAIKKAIQ